MKPFWMVRVVCLMMALLLQAGTGRAALSVRRFPLVFEYTDGHVDEAETTPWTTVIPYVLEGRVAGALGDVPLNLTVRAYLALEFDPAEVWSADGSDRSFPATAWIEEPDEQNPCELSSNFGFSLSVTLRPSFGFKWPELGIGKDFSLSGSQTGGIPFGDRFLGLLDTVELFSLPISELAGNVSAVAEKVISTADDAGLGMASIRGLGELVVDGGRISVTLGGQRFHFTGSGREHSVAVNISVPRNHGLPYLDLYPAASYTCDVYQQLGLVFTLLDPLSLALTPAIMERSVYAGAAYVPPSPSTLYSWYYLMADDLTLHTESDHHLRIRMASTPHLPDLRCTRFDLTPHSSGLYFSTNPVPIRVRLYNEGTRANTALSRIALLLYHGDTLLRTVQVHDDDGSPSLQLQPDQSVDIHFTQTLPPGELLLRLKVTCLEYAYTDMTGFDWFFQADANMANNHRDRLLRVYPNAGGIFGHLYTEPTDLPQSSGGLYAVSNILVRLDGPSLQRSVRTDAGGHWSFEGMPSGIYEVSVLPDKPLNPEHPWYAGKSVRFYHVLGEWNNVNTDPRYQFVYYSQELRQMQNLLGQVVDAVSGDPVPDCRVDLGSPAFRSVHTDADGVFLLPDVPPEMDCRLWFHHPAYDSIPLDISVPTFWKDTTTRDVWVRNKANPLPLPSDHTAPSLECILPAPDAPVRNALTLALRSYDHDKPTDSLRWVLVQHPGGGELASLPWTAYPSALAETWVSTNVPLSSIPDGWTRLTLEVRDARHNTTSSETRILRVDHTPPAVTVLLNGGVPTTTLDHTDVLVSTGTADPNGQEVWLQVSGGDWIGPTPIPPGQTSALIREFPLTSESLFNGSVTVSAKVRDAAGNEGTGSATIAVDTSERVRLANGLPYVTPGLVSVQIDWPVFPAVQHYLERGDYAMLPIGSAPTNTWRAQELRITSVVQIDSISVSVSPPVGSPPPLRLDLLSTLNPDDPLASVLSTAWLPTGTAPGTRVNFSPPVWLGTGTCYLVMSCPQDPLHHWVVNAGVSVYGGSGYPRFDFHSGTGWHAATAEGDGLSGLDTNAFYQLPFQLWGQSPGLARYALDRDLLPGDPWVPLPDVPSSVTFSTEGTHRIALEYTNQLHAAGAWFGDSVIVDGTAPTLSVGLLSLDPATRTACFAVQGQDGLSGLHADFLWRAGEAWTPAPWTSPVCIAFSANAFPSFEFRCADLAGNLAVETVDTAKLGDLFPPTLSLQLADGNPFTTETTFDLHLTATDDQELQSLWVQPPDRSDVWEELPPDTTRIEVSIPPNRLTKPASVVDGDYTWRALAHDAQGNSSAIASASVRLDRAPPVLAFLDADDPQGHPFTTNHLFRVHFHGNDASGSFGYRLEVDGSPLAIGTNHNQRQTLLVTAPDVDTFSYDLLLRTWDGAGNRASFSQTFVRAHPPAAPALLCPNAYVFHSNVVMQTAAFSDADPGDTATATQWRVYDPSDTLILDTGDVQPAATSHRMPQGVFKPGNYTWTCRVQDSFGLWSAWAEPLGFHVYDTSDSDHDGLPDDYEIETLETLAYTGDDDVDRDGSKNREEYLAGTHPRFFSSCLRIEALQPAAANSTRIEWQSVPGLRYRLQAAGIDITWDALGECVGAPGSSTVLDVGALPSACPWVRVQQITAP